MKKSVSSVSAAAEPVWLHTFRKVSFSTLFRRWWMVALLVLLGLATLAQNAMVGTGFGAGWGGACGTNTDFQYLAQGAGNSWIRIAKANGLNNQFFRMAVDWDGQRRQHTITAGTDVAVSPGVEYTLGNTCTTSGAMFINVVNTEHKYVFKTFNAGTNPQYRMVYFRIDGEVQAITNVSVPATVTAGNAATITATLSGALSAGQGVYLRYSRDAFASSTVIPMSGSGTAYTADIPAQTMGTEIKYYCFTSGDGLASTITHANADFYTINANNNGNLNYGFTVQAPAGIATIANGNWSDAATWEGGQVPNTETVRAIVRHTVTINTNISVKDLDIEAAGTLNNTNRTITIGAGGSVRNKGTFNTGQGLFLFKGNATVVDALSIAYAELEAGLVNLGGSTITGSLTLAGGAVDPAGPPVYADNSTLRISTGTTTAAGAEWTTSLSPFNLWVDAASTYTLCSNTPTAAFTLRGGMLLADDARFFADPLCNGNTAQPAGPFQSVAFLTINGNLEIFSGCSFTVQNGDLGSLNQGTRFQVVVKGNVVNDGTLRLNDHIGDDLYVSGDWENTGVFNPGGNSAAGVNPITAQDGRAVFLEGNTLQHIKGNGTAFHYLILQNPAGFEAQTNIEVSRGIAFNNGKLNLNNRTLTIGALFNTHILGRVYASGPGSYAYNGMVIRNVSHKTQPVADDEQVAPNLNEPYIFPVGSATQYRPFTITWSEYPGNAGLAAVRHFGAAGVVSGAEPNLTDTDGTPITRYFADAYWDADFAAISGGNGTFSVQYTCTNCNIGLSNPDKIRAIRRPDPAGTWSLPGAIIPTTGDNVSPTVGRSGLTSFSQYALGFDPIVLPVRLKSFTGARTAQGNMLTWTSSTEENFSHYLLQQSSDARRWTDLARVAGTGGAFEQVYRHLHAKATGLNYYRLYMADKDGTGRYSNTVVIQGNEPAAGTIQAVYRSAQGRIVLIHNGTGFTKEQQVQVTDMQGRVVARRQLQNAPQQEIATGRLAAGIYLVTVQNRNSSQTIRIMVP